MQTVTDDERRARLARRHRLEPAARVDDDVVAAVRSVVVLHATDPATMILSAAIRLRQPNVDPVQAAFYDDRSVLRMLGMRRTLFGVATRDAGLVQAAASDAVATAERKRLVALLDGAGVAKDSHRWLAAVERKTLAAIDDLGEATATDLTPVVPELARQIAVAEGKPYATSVGVSSKVLFQLAAEGHLVRGRPKGGWTSGVHRWSRVEAWLGAALVRPPAAEARAELARRWLARFGPATVPDLKWWTGWTMRDTRAALAALAIEEVDLDGAPGIVLAEDLEPVPTPAPWVALLPGLDPTTMGWQGRDWYLGEHRPRVFDRNGNAGPTVWADGRIVGGWAQRTDGEVRVQLLEDVGRERAAMVREEAGRLEGLLGDVRVTPRFPAPLDRELSA